MLDQYRTNVLDLGKRLRHLHPERLGRPLDVASTGLVFLENLDDTVALLVMALEIQLVDDVGRDQEALGEKAETG